MRYEYHHFLTQSLGELDGKNRIARVLAASINAVDPAEAVKENVKIHSSQLLIGKNIYDLTQGTNIYIVGAGKAGYPMALALSEILGNYLSKGIVIVKDGYISTDEMNRSKSISFLEASHPIPDQRGIEGTNQIIKLLQTTGENDLVFCLISGGGSALLTAPEHGIRLAHLQELIKLLLKCGATINEINTLRKHLEVGKGGNLAKFASQATLISLILSDVVGDPLEVISSGPTVPDSSTYSDAYKIIEKYDLSNSVPGSIVKHLMRGMNFEISETPRIGDPIFLTTQNIIIGSNTTATKAAMQQATHEGFNTILLTNYLQGEARFAGGFFASIARQLRSADTPIERPACILSGGETTVLVTGNGTGGRNMELALGAVEPLSGLPNTILVALATDGSDGSTDAAGAVVTGETLQRASNLNLSPNDYLKNNDSYNFFLQLGDLLKPGITNTNVNDLIYIFSL